MKRNRIAATTVEVTAMGLGTAQFGDLYERFDQARATAIVDKAWDAGIRYFDTAPHYGLGLAEHRLGVALADRSRNDYILSSKVGRLLVEDRDGAFQRQRDFSASGVERSIAESLERLGLDRLDIALIHDPEGDLKQALDQAYPALVELKRQGVIGAIGLGAGELEALTAFARNTEIDAMMIAGRYTLLEQPALFEIVPACVDAGISILNAGVFNSGLLSAPHPASDGRYEYGRVPAELLARAQKLAAFAEDLGSSLPQAALKFAALNDVVASVVIGADSPEQLTSNVNMFEDTRSMDELWSALRASGLIPS